MVVNAFHVSDLEIHGEKSAPSAARNQENGLISIAKSLESYILNKDDVPGAVTNCTIKWMKV